MANFREMVNRALKTAANATEKAKSTAQKIANTAKNAKASKPVSEVKVKTEQEQLTLQTPAVASKKVSTSSPTPQSSSATLTFSVPEETDSLPVFNQPSNTVSGFNMKSYADPQMSEQTRQDLIKGVPQQIEPITTKKVEEKVVSNKPLQGDAQEAATKTAKNNTKGYNRAQQMQRNRQTETLRELRKMNEEDAIDYAKKNNLTGNTKKEVIASQREAFTKARAEGPNITDYSLAYAPHAAGATVVGASVLALASSRGQRSNADLYST